MAYFPWRDEYSVNIGAIDTQHKQLVALLNKLYDAMRDGKGKGLSGNVLNELVEYTKFHFATEEKLMQEHSFPGFLAHLSEHTRLTKKVIEFQQQFNSGSLVSVQLGSFLRDWLINHIMTVDKNYSAFLNGKGVK